MAISDGVADVPEKGAVEWPMEIVWVEPEMLVPNEQNPNEQDDKTFNALVASIQTEGWTQPVTAVPLDDGRFEIVAGEHRWRAAQVLGCKVPVLPLPAEEFDRDRRDWNVVKDNLLRGALNPEKFAALYDRMLKKYDGETLKVLMGFTSEDAFQKVYRSVKAALPPELQKALDDAKDEIRTIDDLSLVLNRLFQTYGDSLPSNMMVFSWGGKEVLWVQADKQLWTLVTQIGRTVTDGHLDMSQTLYRLLDAGRRATPTHSPS